MAHANKNSAQSYKHINEHTSLQISEYSTLWLLMVLTENDCAFNFEHCSTTKYLKNAHAFPEKCFVLKYIAWFWAGNQPNRAENVFCVWSRLYALIFDIKNF